MSAVANPRFPPWQVAAALSTVVVVLLVVGLAALGTVTSPFLVAVGVVLAVQMAVFVHANRWAVREAGAQRFTPATGITIARSAAVVALAGFLTVPAPGGVVTWLPALLFGAAFVFDNVDGTVARATDGVTAFGSRVDAEMDSLALLVGVLVAVGYDLAPTYYLLVGVARYAFVAGIAWRRRHGRPVRDLPASDIRRTLGACQMFVVFLVLSPLLGADASVVLATAAMVPTLLWFLRDWLVVTRRFDPDPG
jgi:CDP-diacylglycerol--glycerol-3-phosphate 3-phosphatidyltransferase